MFVCRFSAFIVCASAATLELAPLHPSPSMRLRPRSEQYNPYFVDQVIAMEARAAAVGAPPQRYMFPQNSGLNAADAARAMAELAPDVIPRILADLHVGAGGAVQEAVDLFAHPVVPGYNAGGINAETNANTHDLQRALDEAADLITWMTYDTAVTGRLYARTSSFCTGSSYSWDDWDQGIAMFLPNSEEERTVPLAAPRQTCHYTPFPLLFSSSRTLQ